MGWGVTVNGVYLSRLYKSQLKDKYEENELHIRNARERLLLLAGATPRRVPTGEGHLRDEIEWEEYVHQEIYHLMELIEECAGQNYVIVQALEDMDSAKDT